MEQKLQKRYGLPTAVCMVVGIVIGSGVFFKAEAVLRATGGNMPLGIAAWAIVGAIMIVCSYVFATLAARHEKTGGLADYAEVTVGPGYAYAVGWFSAVIYVPTLVSALAWVSARYVCVLLGWDIRGGACMTIAGFFLCMAFALNTLSPTLAGKLQVSATVVKMVPLVLMGVAGTAAGLMNGRMAEDFSAALSAGAAGTGGGLMAAVVSVAFAYEGWILATSISAELHDARRNLPRALVMGSFIVVVTYILYYIGLNGAASTEELMASGETAAKLAFQRIFGSVGGTMVFVLVVISCLGTLNGLMLACCRGFYALGSRGWGPKPAVFVRIDEATNMPVNSSVMALALSAFWLMFFYGANLAEPLWLGRYGFDSSELPIITLYGFYIPIFLQMMGTERDLPVCKRVVLPVLAVVSCCFMVYAAFAAHGMQVLYYLVVFAACMAAGLPFRNRRKGAEEEES